VTENREAIAQEWAAHTARSSRDAAKLTAVREPSSSTPKPIRSQVLEAAEKAVNGERDQAYGAPATNFANIAAFWNTYLGPKLTEPITPGDVAVMNVLQKVARSMTSPSKTDHWVDTAGYAALAAEINQEKQ
jgi:hypothetical protein